MMMLTRTIGGAGRLVLRRVPGRCTGEFTIIWPKRISFSRRKSYTKIGGLLRTKKNQRICSHTVTR